MERNEFVTIRRLAAGAILWLGFLSAWGQPRDPAQPDPGPTGNAPAALPMLTSAEGIHRLTREEAKRRYPVLFRGVVICPLPQFWAFVVHDFNRGIYVTYRQPPSKLPEIGDSLEIGGMTDPGEFAPCVVAERIAAMGKASLPQPLRPTWDQLINGSMDAQLVQVEGVVTKIHSNGVTLLTHGGKIQTTLEDSSLRALAPYQHALVQLRGCLLANRDPSTHQVTLGAVHIYSATFSVEEAAPTDVFAIAPKHPPELTLFDPQASALQRVKLRGLILCERNGEFFLMDGASGARFVPASPANVQTRDLVEVVGFPTLTAPSPVLHEAMVRKLGVVELPPPRPLGPENLFRAENDATQVRVDAVLLGMSADRRTLELQAGLRRFLARLPAQSGPAKPLKVGSRLRVTGVYDGHGGDRSRGIEVDSFELLLSSHAAVGVLGQPSWWTFQRLLVVVVALLGVLAGAFVWIQMLHHKVRVRTVQLQQEIRERELAEHQRVLEQERARIARDLHDDLGSNLTEISMLAAAGPGARTPPEEVTERLGLIANKSRAMVHDLDEIVWAVDPQRDTLASVVRYLASYVEERLGALNLACRVQLPGEVPNVGISGEVRHHLFLAVKEALNNALRHAQAAEILFQVRLAPDQVQIQLSDDGAGFKELARDAGNGLANLRTRLGKLGGRCEISSAPGQGTTVMLLLPLPIQLNSL